MTKRVFRPSTLLLPILLGLFFFAQSRIERLYALPFPPFKQLLTTNSGFQDAAFIVLGFRSMAADVAWVQLLQSMGDYGRAEEKGLRYPKLKEDTLRVTRIDPYFKRAYVFGAATLAYLHTTNRPEEALEVLREGMQYNPTYWPFQKFVTGIGYKQTNQFPKMVEMLEESIRHPDCPSMVKAILANAYKLHQRYAEAIVLWETILNDANATDYHQRAAEQISEIGELLGRRAH